MFADWSVRCAASGASSRVWAWLCLLAPFPDEPLPPQHIPSGDVLPTPALGDRGELCADIGATRACWRRGGTFVVDRPVPAGSWAPDAYRCGGMGTTRVCEARRRHGASFLCDDDDCVQARPRLPDAGEWDCVELSGVVVCQSRGPAAGIEPGPLALGFFCGARRGNTSERICVDLAPDRPEQPVFGRCAFEYVRGEPERVCRRGEATLVGGTCVTSAGCPLGASCVGGRCLPPRPSPSCWLDADCGAHGRCGWGTCAEPKP